MTRIGMYNVMLRNWLIFNILNEKNKYLRNLESYIILQDAAGEKSKIVEAIEVIDKYKSKDKKTQRRSMEGEQERGNNDNKFIQEFEKEKGRHFICIENELIY